MHKVKLWCKQGLFKLLNHMLHANKCSSEKSEARRENIMDPVPRPMPAKLVRAKAKTEPSKVLKLDMPEENIDNHQRAISATNSACKREQRRIETIQFDECGGGEQVNDIQRTYFTQ